MRDITIYCHEDGKARMIPWSDRDCPKDSELYPAGARLTVYTTMPHDWIALIKSRTEDEVSEILSHIIP